MFSQGDDSLVPIPVFPSRVFRHSALYVKKGSGVDTLDKLRGKRVGDPDFAHTAGIYARGYLMHDVGIKLEEIEWVQAGTNKPGRHENLELKLPATVKRVSVPDKTLDDMLLAGEIDAILSAIPPKSFIAGNPNMVRLVPEPCRGRDRIFQPHRHLPDHAFRRDQAAAVRAQSLDGGEPLPRVRGGEGPQHRAHQEHDDLALPAAVESRQCAARDRDVRARTAGPTGSSRTARRWRRS